MTQYKVGTHIDFKKQAKRQELKDDLLNSLFWALLIFAFIWCIWLG